MKLSQKQMFLVIAAAFAAFFLWLLFGGGGEPKRYPRSGEHIIAFGDSLVEGAGASPGNDFVSLLSQRLGVPIVNAGRSGDTTASALLRFESDVLSQNPKIVILLLGGNDAIRRIPPGETMQNLGMMIDWIHRRGAAALLVGVRGGLFIDDFKKGFRNLEKKKGVFYVPDVIDDVFGHPDFMYDGIHPNDAGYAIMADRIEPVLREMLKGK